MQAEIVAQDEFDHGIRATLNLGHTFGHALETACGYGTLLHGEAVGIGMAMAAEMSSKIGLLPRDVMHRIVALIQAANLPVSLQGVQLVDDNQTQSLSTPVLLDLMSSDKKNTEGRVTLCLIQEDIGNCVVTEAFERHSLVEVLDSFVNQS